MERKTKIKFTDFECNLLIDGSVFFIKSTLLDIMAIDNVKGSMYN